MKDFLPPYRAAPIRPMGRPMGKSVAMRPEVGLRMALGVGEIVAERSASTLEWLGNAL
jgi:hypothetical protein